MTNHIENAFLSENFGPYRKGSRVFVHKIHPHQDRFYALVEMGDGELRTLEVEYLTTGSDLEREKKRQKEALAKRPDLWERSIPPRDRRQDPGKEVSLTTMTVKQKQSF